MTHKVRASYDMKALFSFTILVASSLPAVSSQLAGSGKTPSRPGEVVTTTTTTVTQTTTKTQSGIASWYGGGFIGGKTANGESYRSTDRTAAHKTLPFGTWVKVTERAGGRSTVVRINNRGPYVKGRVIDLSVAAANEIGLTKRGVAPVTLEVLPGAPTAKKPMSLGRSSFWDNPLFR